MANDFAAADDDAAAAAVRDVDWLWKFLIAAQ